MDNVKTRSLAPSWEALARPLLTVLEGASADVNRIEKRLASGPPKSLIHVDAWHKKYAQELKHAKNTVKDVREHFIQASQIADERNVLNRKVCNSWLIEGLTEEAIASVFSTALYCGINHWCSKVTDACTNQFGPSFEHPLHPGKCQDDLAADLVSGGEVKLHFPDGSITLTRDKFIIGILRAADWREMSVVDFIENHDDGDSDLAVQLAIFDSAQFS